MVSEVKYLVVHPIKYSFTGSFRAAQKVFGQQTTTKNIKVFHNTPIINGIDHIQTSLTLNSFLTYR